MPINPVEILQTFPDWDIEKDSNGFYVYTKDNWAGCIRQNHLNGTTEVFNAPASDVIANPIRSDVLYIEDGYIGCDGVTQFTRATLFVDIYSETN